MAASRPPDWRVMCRVAAVGCLLVAGLVSAVPARAAFTDADYWTFADRHMTGLDDRWRGDRLAYTDERGQAEIRENAGMLLAHAIAAFAGHVGPTRQDVRARVLVDRLTMPPAWLGSGLAPPASTSTCWSADLDRPVRGHMSLEPKVAEALAWALRARAQLRALARRRTADRRHGRRVRRLAGVALPAAVAEPDQLELGDVCGGGDGDRTARPAARRLSPPTRRVRGRAHTADAGHEVREPRRRLRVPLPTGSSRAGRRATSTPPSTRTSRSRRSCTTSRRCGSGCGPCRQRPSAGSARGCMRLLAGSWTHAGYLNWDTSRGLRRWHSGQYWAYAQQGLQTIAVTPRFWRRPQQGAWAKSMFDQGLVLYRRLADESGGTFAPQLMFDVDTRMKSNAVFRWRILANVARAIALGLGRAPAAEPPPLWAFDPDTGRLAVTTPRYSTAIVPDDRDAWATAASSSRGCSGRASGWRRAPAEAAGRVRDRGQRPARPQRAGLAAAAGRTADPGRALAGGQPRRACARVSPLAVCGPVRAREGARNRARAARPRRRHARVPTREYRQPLASALSAVMSARARVLPDLAQPDRRSAAQRRAGRAGAEARACACPPCGA